MAPLLCGFSGPLFPGRPPTPSTPQLSSLASHAPYFLPREGGCWGLLSQPWECSWRLNGESWRKRRTGRGKGPPPAWPRRSGLPRDAQTLGQGWCRQRIPMSLLHPDLSVRPKTGTHSDSDNSHHIVTYTGTCCNHNNSFQGAKHLPSTFLYRGFCTVPQELATIVIPILQMKRLRPAEVTTCLQGHVASPTHISTAPL